MTPPYRILIGNSGVDVVLVFDDRTRESVRGDRHKVEWEESILSVTPIGN